MDPTWPTGPPAPPVVGFPRDAARWTPMPWLFTAEDVLQLDSVCSQSGVTVTVNGVLLSADLQLLPFSWTHSPNSNRTVATTRVSLGLGWLQHVRVLVTGGAAKQGECFVALRVCRGLTSNAIVLATIAAGYVTTTTDLYTPGGTIGTSLDGAGTVRSITGTTPAAGADILETVPTNARWELIAFTAQLTTSAVVASRVVGLTIDDGTNIYFRDSPAFTQTANLIDIYSFANGQSKIAAPSSSFVLGNVPVDNRLIATHRIRTKTLFIDVGDQWTAPQYLVREWLENN